MKDKKRTPYVEELFQWSCQQQGRINYSKIPTHMREGLECYVEHHVEPGRFLRAALENNFVLAVGYTDMADIKHFIELANVLYNELPGNCWGSKEKVQNWLDQRGK